MANFESMIRGSINDDFVDKLTQSFNVQCCREWFTIVEFVLRQNLSKERFVVNLEPILAYLLETEDWRHLDQPLTDQDISNLFIHNPILYEPHEHLSKNDIELLCGQLTKYMN